MVGLLDLLVVVVVDDQFSHPSAAAMPATAEITASENFILSDLRDSCELGYSKG